MSGQLRAGTYRRVSTPGQQEEGTSLATQEARNVAYCAGKGYRVVVSEEDVGSGFDLDGRAGLARVREAVRRREIDVLVVFAVDRLSRNLNHQGLLFWEAEHAGCRIESVTEDLSGPAGHILRAVMGIVAEIERTKIAERTARGKLAKVQAGKPLGTQRVDFGLRWADDRDDQGKPRKERFVPDEATAPFVREMFESYDRGSSLRGLQRLLATRGIMPPQHGRTGATKWALPVLRRVLQNRHYIGVGYQMTTRTIKTANGGRTVVARPREEWIELPAGTYPQVVDLALFARVQERLAQTNKRESQRRDRNPAVGLLRRGVGQCGYCGKALTLGHNEGVAIYRCAAANRDRYGCPGHNMRVDLLDAQVWSVLARRLREPEVLEADLLGLRHADPTADSLPAAEAALGRLEQRRATLRRRLGEEEDDLLAAEYRAELAQVLADIRAAEADRAALLDQRAAWASAAALRQGVLGYASELAARIDGMTWQDKRQELMRLGAQVRLFRSDHAPRWEFDSRWSVARELGTFGYSARTDAAGDDTVVLTDFVPSAEYVLPGCTIRSWNGHRPATGRGGGHPVSKGPVATARPSPAAC